MHGKISRQIAQVMETESVELKESGLLPQDGRLVEDVTKESSPWRRRVPVLVKNLNARRIAGMNDYPYPLPAITVDESDLGSFFFRSSLVQFCPA